jgi:glycogen synthase
MKDRAIGLELIMSTGPRTIVCCLEPKERHAGMPSSPNRNPNPGAEVLEARPLQRAGMKADFSWNNRGKLSADLYRELTGKA